MCRRVSASISLFAVLLLASERAGGVCLMSAPICEYPDFVWQPASLAPLLFSGTLDTAAVTGVLLLASAAFTALKQRQ